MSDPFIQDPSILFTLLSVGMVLVGYVCIAIEKYVRRWLGR